MQFFNKRPAVIAGLILIGGCAMGRADAQTLNGPINLGIDDGATTISFVGTSPYGFDPGSFNSQISQEGIGTLGIADLSGEYHSANPLSPGTAQAVNFNFLDMVGGPISDTLNITFTGHTLDQFGNNMSVGQRFRSDSSDGILPPSLSNAHVLVETGGFQVLDSFVIQDTGISDYHIRIRSADTPEPGSLTLLGGMLLTGVGFVIRRRRA